MAPTDRIPASRVEPPSRVQRTLRPTDITALAQSLVVRGQLSATEHVIIEGFFEGEIVIPDHEVAISGAAYVHGEIWARAITVLGRVDGNLTASALIELRETADVTGRLAAPLLSIEEGARFHGRVEPSKAATALAVARHRLQQSARTPAATVEPDTATGPTGSLVPPVPATTWEPVRVSVATDT